MAQRRDGGFDAQGHPFFLPKFSSAENDYEIRAATSGSDLKSFEFETDRGELAEIHIEQTAGSATAVDAKVYQKLTTPGDEDLIAHLASCPPTFHWSFSDRPKYENADTEKAGGPARRKLHVQLTPDTGDDNDFSVRLVVREGI